MTVTARSTFVEELKARRGRAGLTQELFAEKALMSLSLLKKIERGERRPQRDFALWCDQFFGQPGTFERMHRLTLLETFPEWFADRMIYEEEASSITEWEMRVIPGLLQTRAYVQAMFRNGKPFATEAELTRDIGARIERQEILNRDDPPKLWVVLAEGPLHQCVGGPAVMKAQLNHLVELTDSPKCVLQVLPFTACDAPMSAGPATFFEFRDKPPVAYMEGWGAGWVVEEQKQVANIAAWLNMTKGYALSPAQSRKLLIEIKDTL